MTLTLKRLSAALVLSVALLPTAHAAQDGDTERLIRRITPPIQVIEGKIEKKDHVLVDSFYETSNVVQGARTGHWNEITTLFGYTHRNITSYVSNTQFERFDNKDYTMNIGSYMSFPDSGYAHIETGFGWMVDYLYKFIAIAEYGHRAYKTLYWQLGYSYRGYASDDVHMIYPGLIYYFGDSYLAADFGINITENHDTAYFGTFKGNCAITDFLNLWGAISFGEKLYDIYGFDAHEETGYILSIGLTYKVYKDIKLRFGYSYGEEAPKFIKRSVNFAAQVKF